MNRRRTTTSLVTALALTLAFGGLAAGSQPTRAAERPVLRYGLDAADLGRLDPHFASGTNDRTVVDMVFNGLVRFKPGDSQTIEPDLATAIPEPTETKGKQVWTFALRHGVMCQPEEKTPSYELTADDVVASLQKSADKNRSAYAAEYTGMSVVKADPYTVNITLDQPLSSALFLPKVANYAGGFIVCAKALAKMGDEAFNTHPVGTGPFTFTSYTPQNEIVLTAFDNYFRGKPALGGVDLRFMPDISSRELALQAGELDVAAGLSEAQWVERIKSMDGLTADVFGVGEEAFINFNVTVKPLNDPRVRQAIAYAVSRDDHLALFGSPVAEKVYSVVPAQFMPGGLSQEDAEKDGLTYDQDLNKAKQLLAEAGYPDGFSLDLTTSEMPSYLKNYQALQAEVAKVGIKINLKTVDHPTMHALIRKDTNPIVIYIAFRPNADAYLTQFFESKSIVVSGANPVTNFSHYDKIDDLIAQARAQTDPAKQAALWEQANVKILQDMAAMPLIVVNQVYARSTKVDYGHELVSSLALYPQITEATQIKQ